MREVYIVLILFFGFITINFGQIVDESFEDISYPPIGWAEFNTDQKINGQPFAWDTAHVGIYRAQFTDAGEWIQTKPIKNPDVLTFWIRTSTDGNNEDIFQWSMIVQTSLDGINFTDHLTIVEDGIGGDITSDYTQITVDLNLTGLYVIRWYMDQRDYDWAFLDYVNVSQTYGTSNVADHLVISEIYSRGGRTDEDATYKSDYVTLYNPTESSIDISNWSVQVYDGESQYLVTSLLNSIAPDDYYLIQLYTGSIGSDLPNPPNVVNTSVSLGTYVGQIALVNDQVEISGKDDSEVIDFVGYTADADGIDYYGDPDEFEGFLWAHYPSTNTMSIRRKDNDGNETSGTIGSGYDINDNRSDFYVVTDLISEPPLPVELTSFTASELDKGTILDWTTATEVNNYGFEIERAPSPINMNSDWGSDSSNIELRNWETIGFVEGHGNSYSPRNYSYLDTSILSGDINYRLKQIDIDGNFVYSDMVLISLSVTAISSVNNIEYKLYQNHPNPFNPSTEISFALHENSIVNVTIYNMLGQKVIELVNQPMDTGYHSVSFYGSSLSSGLYLYRLETPKYSKTMKMMLLK